MIAEIAVMSVTFASVATALGAVGLFLRDLTTAPLVVQRKRLEFGPEEPVGGFNRAFFRLVEESGTSLDMATALALVVGLGIVGLATPLVMFENLLGAAAGTLLGAAIPLGYFIALRFFRLRQMRQVLSQALQAVADSVRSGQSLSQACQLVGQEIKGPLGQEFAFAHSQLELGHSPLAVMNRLVRRVPLSEIRVFATAVVVHRQAGGNLSLLTERMSKVAHDRQETRNHMLAVTAGSRMSAIGMVLAGAIALLVLGWLEPEYLDTFLKHPQGPWLLGTSALLQAIGGLWVWQILKPTA
ncbi:MAG: type II secretion system F family protein [Pirellulaceae bacterium]